MSDPDEDLVYRDAKIALKEMTDAKDAAETYFQKYVKPSAAKLKQNTPELNKLKSNALSMSERALDRLNALNSENKKMEEEAKKNKNASVSETLKGNESKYKSLKDQFLK